MAELIGKAVQYSVDSDGIATLAFNMVDYPTNVINRPGMDGFRTAAERALKDATVKGIVLTSSRKEFLAGADLNLILALTDVQEVFDMTMEMHHGLRALEAGGKPVVAALNGTALGGGYEVAMACHHILALDDDRIKIGLPEVQLGVFPGGGGTQRLPRRVGLQAGLEFILQAKQVRPKQALKAGLIDGLAPDAETLLAQAKQWILDGGNATQPWDEKKFKYPGGGPMTPGGAQVLTAGIALLRKQTWGNYPGTEYALRAVYEGSQVPFDRALEIEARYFAKAVVSKEAKHMINTLFFRLNAANKGEARPDVQVPEIKKVGMLGAGMMGAGIAYVTANAGMDVVLKDVSQEAAENGKAYGADILKKKLSKGHISQDKHDTILSRILPTAKADDLTGCDLVIEAVFEDRALKAKVTQEAEAAMNPRGVFASNTSTLPITGLAEASARPEKFIGLHFFSPVDKMPLVEIILGEKTGDAALATAIDYVRKIGKTPIVVRDGRGFYTSRVFATYVNEGMELLREGVPPALIENAGKAAGMPVGPLALADEVSLSLLHHIVKQTEKDLGKTLTHASAEVGKLFVEQLDRPGKKAGKGLYDYPKNEKKHLWPGLAQHFPPKPEGEYPDFETCKKRLLHIQAVETARCLEEGILQKPADADVGSILGWGFAPFTGGTASYVDFVGPKQFLTECADFALRFGERFNVPGNLRARAEQGLGYFD